MQISTSPLAANSVSKDLPVSLQSALLNGKQLEATVIARVSAEVVKIKLGDIVLQIKADPSFQVGQKVSVERQPQTGELLIKPVSTAATPESLLNRLLPLQAGQTVAVEVIKLLADKRMLVSPIISNEKSNPSQAAATKLPAQIDIDISMLKHIPKIGERLALEVVREQPLSVNLRTEQPSIKEQVQRIQRDLLPLLDKPNVVTERLNKLLPRLLEIPGLQKPVANLLSHIADKPALARPAVLYQAIQRSGIFLESQLKHVSVTANTDIKTSSSEQVMQSLALTNKPNPIRNTSIADKTLPPNIDKPNLQQTIQPKVSSFFAVEHPEKTDKNQPPASPNVAQNQVAVSAKTSQSPVVRPEVLQQDFKANLLQLTSLIRQQLTGVGQGTSVTSEKLYQSLPVEIREAMQAILKSPQSLQKLPAQIQIFLASQGRTPANLLVGLLTSFQPGSTSTSTSLTTPLTSQLSHVLPQLMNISQQNQPTQTSNQPSQLIQMQLLRDVVRELDTLSARVQSHQLQMVKDPDNPTNTNVWLFDLPVKDRQQLELLQMRFEQRMQADEEDTVWQVQLNLETVNLGPMQAQITLHKEKVSVLLLAAREESAAVLKSDLAELEHSLDKLGMSVSHIDCRQATINELSKAPVADDDDSIVNISV